jgi:hypothetical protein
MGGAWRTPTEYSVKMNGAWGKARGVYVRAGGQWRTLYQRNIQAEQGTMGDGVSTYQEYPDYVQLYARSVSGSGARATMVLGDRVDLTNVKTIKYRIQSDTSSPGAQNDVILTISNSKTGTLNNAVKSFYTPQEYQNWTMLNLNVQDVSGWFYIRIHASANQYTDITRVVRVNEIWLVLSDNSEVLLWNATMG